MKEKDQKKVRSERRPGTSEGRHLKCVTFLTFWDEGRSECREGVTAAKKNVCACGF